MIVRRFIEWTQNASAGGRAEAACALARAFLYSDLDIEQRAEAIAALTLLLDDPAPIVRRAIAESLASAVEAPPHIVVALALDQSDIAAIVLARSPVLRDADLIDAVAVGDVAAHLAIACRPDLSPGVCAALAEIAGPDALIALLRNRNATPPDFCYRRMIERCGDAAALRETMLARSDLPAGVRHMLVVAVSNALAAFVQDCAWMRPERGERIMAEAKEAAAVTIAAEANDCSEFVQHLASTRQLTAGLLLRSLLSGRIALLESALAELSGQPLRRVSAILAERPGGGFAALYRKAGLPAGLYRAFHAALDGWREMHAGAREDRPAALSRLMIERTLTAVDAAEPENAKLLALLRRFEAEAAREEARAFIAEIMHDPIDELERDIRKLVEEQAALIAA